MRKTGEIHSQCSLDVSLGSCCHNKYFLTNTAQIAACLHMYVIYHITCMLSRSQALNVKDARAVHIQLYMYRRNKFEITSWYKFIITVCTMVSLVPVLTEASITAVTALQAHTMRIQTVPVIVTYFMRQTAFCTFPHPHRNVLAWCYSISPIQCASVKWYNILKTRRPIIAI